MPQPATSMTYHLVFSTKDRAPSILIEFQPRLYEALAAAVKAQGGAFISAGGARDHVHLLAALGAHRTVADTVRGIKDGSMRWVRENVPGKPEFAWQESYAMFAVSQSNVCAVKKYLAEQETRHEKMSYQQEVRRLLQKHQMGIDERNLLE
jgi:putative transposase